MKVKPLVPLALASVMLTSMMTLVWAQGEYPKQQTEEEFSA